VAILQIIEYPDERLMRLSEPVTQFDDELSSFIADLDETRLQAPGCVGIAAPQVARFQRIVIVDLGVMRKPQPNHGHMVLINPEITEWEGYVKGREGCLSVPAYTGNVMRAEKIRLEAMDANGDTQQFEFSGFEARAVQHEVDHLDGLLFLNRLVSRRNDLFQRKNYK
jgi:peptide deformylase